MTNKDLYQKFCANEKYIPIFMQPWWLKAVCGDYWDVALVVKGDHIHAVLPYSISNKGRYSLQPKLTQFLGPYIKYPPDQKYTTKLSYEKKIMEELILALPKFTYFKHNFSPKIDNWLPFYWSGYKQTTRYSYIIPKSYNSDDVWREMAGNIRRNIQKAEKVLTVYDSDDIDLFYKLNKNIFERQSKKIPYSLSFVKSLDKACVANEARKIYMASDKSGKIHASIYVVFDNTTVYYLMGGSDNELRTGGGTSLLMWHAIQDALDMDLDFNFEGSMIQPIERYFSSFGSMQQQLFTIEKDNRFLLQKLLSSIYQRFLK